MQCVYCSRGVLIVLMDCVRKLNRDLNVKVKGQGRSNS